MKRIRGFFPLQIIVDDSKTVGDLLRDLRSASNEGLLIGNYGEDWWLRDKANPKHYLHRHQNDVIFFERKLNTMGIKPGMTLEIVNEPSQFSLLIREKHRHIYLLVATPALPTSAPVISPLNNVQAAQSRPADNRTRSPEIPQIELWYGNTLVAIMP